MTDFQILEEIHAYSSGVLMTEDYILTAKHLFEQYLIVNGFVVEIPCKLETIELAIKSQVRSHTYAKEKWGWESRPENTGPSTAAVPCITFKGANS